MSGHTIGIFLHIAGALGISAALALEWTGLRQIRSTILPEQVRAWMGIFKSANRLSIISMLVTVLTGIYMMFAAWGTPPWIIVSLGSVALMIVLAIVPTGPRMAAIGRVLTAEKRPVSQTLYSLVSHPLLWISIQTRVAIFLGILLLMIAKLDWVGSLIVMGVTIILGLASVLPLLRGERAQKGLAD